MFDECVVEILNKRRQITIFKESFLRLYGGNWNFILHN